MTQASPITASSAPLSKSPITNPQKPPQGVPNKSEAEKLYRESPISTIPSEWSVPAIRATIRQHEAGQFFQSARLVDAMLGDDRINHGLQELIGGALRLPFRIRKAKGSKKARKVRKAVREMWSRAVPTKALMTLCKWSVMLGFGVAEVIWDLSDPKKWVPTGLKVWDPRYIYWREDIRRYVVLTADGQVEVEPGNGKWILLEPTGDRGWQNGLVRQLWRWWIVRDYVWRDWSHFSEVMGHPIITGDVPAEAPPASKNAFREDINTMGTDGVAILEKSKDGWGYGLGLLEAKTDHSKGFGLLIDKCEANITTAILGQNATSQNDGPYVARGVFAKVTLDKIDSLIGPLEEALCEQLTRPFCEFNFGKSDLAPIPDWDSEPPPDKAEFAASLMNLGQFLETSFQGGYAPSVKQLSKRMGLKIRRQTAPALLQIQAGQQAATRSGGANAAPSPKPATSPKEAPAKPASTPSGRLAALLMSPEPVTNERLDQAMTEYADWRAAA